MKYEVGSAVTAAARLYETHPDGRQQLVARPGDRGVVIHVSRNGAPLVKFTRGAIDCNDSDLDLEVSRHE